MSILEDLLSLFYPSLCAGCGSPLVHGETIICLACLADLPCSGIEDGVDNPVSQIFYGRIKLGFAYSLCRFDKGGHFQHLLHALKYKGNNDLAILLGAILGKKMLLFDFSQDIDCIVPVPLHRKREKERGFNQSMEIAKGFSGATSIPVAGYNLIRKCATTTQTAKNRVERWENVREVFQLINPSYFAGKHILLIDDVVTTGATLEACATLLLELSGTRVSVATLAYA